MQEVLHIKMGWSYRVNQTFLVPFTDFMEDIMKIVLDSFSQHFEISAISVSLVKTPCQQLNLFFFSS